MPNSLLSFLHVEGIEGIIQFSRKEFLVTSNSTKVEVMIEKIYGKEVEVKWKLSHNNFVNESNGTIKFDMEESLKVITFEIQNVTDAQSIEIRLFEATKGYQIGHNNIAQINFVCK